MVGCVEGQREGRYPSGTQSGLLRGVTKQKLQSISSCGSNVTYLHPFAIFIDINCSQATELVWIFSRVWLIKCFNDNTSKQYCYIEDGESANDVCVSLF